MLCFLKKDFLLAKKYIPFVMMAVLALPAARASKLNGADGMQSALTFAFEAIYSEFLVCRYLAMKEFQYPKAASFLCTLPYARGMQVISKYLIYAMIFAFCCMAYWANTLFVPNLSKFGAELAVPALFMASVLYSVYMPVQYQFGYEKSKFVFLVLMTAVPLLIADTNTAVIVGSLPKLTYPAMLGLALAALGASAVVSVKIFDGKEL